MALVKITGTTKMDREWGQTVPALPEMGVMVTPRLGWRPKAATLVTRLRVLRHKMDPQWTVPMPQGGILNIAQRTT